MKSTLSTSERSESPVHVAPSRLLWVGPLVVAATLVANAAVREVALRWFGVVPTFHHLQWSHLVSITVVAMSLAVIVFAAVTRSATRPIRLYWHIAGVVLLLSLIPDLALLFGSEPGHSATGVGALVVMHVVDAAICVGMLTMLTRRR